MIDDILTVMWKERKGLFRFRGSRTRFLLTLLMPVLMAFQGPLSDGPDWVEQEGSVIFAAIIPVIVVLITVPESFAGERERHTLGTLLASRLPDRAILFGKLAVSLAFAWGVTLIVLLLGLVIVNVAHGDGELLFFTPTIALADLAVSFLLATLCAGAGVLISLRSATVQEAAQTLAAVFFMPPMLLTMALLLFRDQVRDIVGSLSGEQILLVIVVLLAAADLAVFAAAMARFQRSRLYLD
jgi:ABC-2 type transport system permease protein